MMLPKCQMSKVRNCGQLILKISAELWEEQYYTLFI
jgi:hypothetical protein